MNAESAKLAQERALAPKVVEGTFEFQGEIYNFKATPKQETKMSDQHRATDIEWACIEALTDDNATYSCILELLCRIEALEAAADRAASEAFRAASTEIRPSEVATTEAKPKHLASPDSSLVDWVADAIYKKSGTGGGFREEARAAVREVADWFEKQGGAIALGWAMRLEEEAKR